MPYLQQIHDAYSSQGLVLLAVDYAEKPETVRSFMTSNNLSLTIPMDTDGKVTKSYLVTGIPRTLFIDKDGIIRGIMPGNFPNKEAIESMLTSIMP
jgi:peroxiredoxin